MRESPFQPSSEERDAALDRLAEMSEAADGYEDRGPAGEALFAEDISGGK